MRERRQRFTDDSLRGWPCPRQLRYGFSLVELLVVIGIIAILIGILLPTIVSARQQANLLKCASNQRQILQGCALHAHEHRGFMPLAGLLQVDQFTDSGVNILPSALHDTSRSRYDYATAPGTLVPFVITPLPAALAPYLSSQKLAYDDWSQLDQQLDDNRGIWQMFMCPSTDAFERHHASSNAYDATPVGQGAMMVVMIDAYASNLWSSNSDYGFNEGVFGFDYRTDYAAQRLAGNTAHVRRPAETMLFCDAKLAQLSDPMFSIIFPYPWITFAPALGAQNVTLADALAQNSNVMPNRAQFDPLRHRNRLNIAFADGHVASSMITSGDLQKVYLSGQ